MTDRTTAPASRQDRLVAANAARSRAAELKRAAFLASRNWHCLPPETWTELVEHLQAGRIGEALDMLHRHPPGIQAELYTGNVLAVAGDRVLARYPTSLPDDSQ